MRALANRTIWAFDIGTSSLKALSLAPGGKVLAFVSKEYPLHFSPDGRVECNPQDWESAFRECAGELNQQQGSWPEGIIVGGQGPTLVPLSSKYEALGNAISWMDRRAIAEAEELSSIQKRRIDSQFYMPKALWFFRHHPLKEKLALYTPCPEYLILKLTGKAVSGLPHPDFAEMIWNNDLMSLFGLERNLWPEFYPVGTVVGQITNEAERYFNIKTGIPVILGAPDFVESLIGTGTIQPGRACDRGGSSQGINLCISHPQQIPGFITLPHLIQGCWNISGVISTTGKTLEKVKEWVGWKNISFEETIKRSLQAPPGCNGLIFIPHLAGERSPKWNPDFRGVFFGLDLNHRPEHLVRAALESIGFAIKQIIELLEENSLNLYEFRSTGKQAYSLDWTKIKADITNRPFLIPLFKESEPLGGAIIAGLSLGWYSAIEKAVDDIVKIEKVVYPDPGRTELYNEYFQLYESLTSKLESDFSTLKRIKNLKGGE
ncbi:MAG: FGGY family carbohydrate kinase [Nitrososphaerota archaeon]